MAIGKINKVKVDNRYNLYYSSNSYPPYNAEHTIHNLTFCLLTSEDGIHFKPEKVNKHDFFGNKENNIVFVGGEYTDNFTVMYDNNPNCPKNEKFKALSGGKDFLENGRSYGVLDLYTSPDGIDFSFKQNWLCLLFVFTW